MNIDRFILKVHRQVLAGELTPQVADLLLAQAQAGLEADLREVEKAIRKEKENECLGKMAHEG